METTRLQTHLSETGGKEDTFKELPHLLEELVHVGSFQHVHLQEFIVKLERKTTCNTSVERMKC